MCAKWRGQARPPAPGPVDRQTDTGRTEAMHSQLPALEISLDIESDR